MNLLSSRYSAAGEVDRGEGWSAMSHRENGMSHPCSWRRRGQAMRNYSGHRRARPIQWLHRTRPVRSLFKRKREKLNDEQNGYCVTIENEAGENKWLMK